MPNIEVLSLDHTSIDTWSDIVQDSLATLVKGGDGSMLLPHLKELSLLSRRPTAPNTHDSEVSRTLRNLAIERRGTLTLLTMPPFHDHETLQILTANIERVTVSNACHSSMSPYTATCVFLFSLTIYSRWNVRYKPCWSRTFVDIIGQLHPLARPFPLTPALLYSCTPARAHRQCCIAQSGINLTPMNGYIRYLLKFAFRNLNSHNEVLHKGIERVPYDAHLLEDFDSLIERYDLLLSRLPVARSDAEWRLSRELCESKRQPLHIYNSSVVKDVLHVSGIFHCLRTASFING